MALNRTQRKQLKAVFAQIEAEQKGYGKGMSGEGYAGGYYDALCDLDAILRGVPPGDKWGFWRRADNALHRSPDGPGGEG